VGVVLVKHQLTEVSVVGDQDALLASGESEHLLVGKTQGIVAANTSCVMAMLGEKHPDARLCTLIEEKPHRPD
jgi:hypothetical protein